MDSIYPTRARRPGSKPGRSNTIYSPIYKLLCTSIDPHQNPDQKPIFRMQNTALASHSLDRCEGGGGCSKPSVECWSAHSHHLQQAQAVLFSSMAWLRISACRKQENILLKGPDITISQCLSMKCRFNVHIFACVNSSKDRRFMVIKDTVLYAEGLAVSGFYIRYAQRALLLICAVYMHNRNI